MSLSEKVLKILDDLETDFWSPEEAHAAIMKEVLACVPDSLSGAGSLDGWGEISTGVYEQRGFNRCRTQFLTNISGTPTKG